MHRSTAFDQRRHLGFDVAQLSNDVEDLGPKAAQALPLLALLAVIRAVEENLPQRNEDSLHIRFRFVTVHRI